MVAIDKVISESEVTFYNNIWLDTQSIQLAANPSIYKNYKVEGIERRTEPIDWGENDEQAVFFQNLYQSRV